MCPVDFIMIEGGLKQSGICPFNRNLTPLAKLQMFVADYMQHPRKYMPGKVNATETLGQVVTKKYIQH